MTRRAGVTLVECLVALALAALLSAAVATVLTTHGRAVRALTVQAADAEAHRITAAVLRAELRLLVPASDVRALAGDSIAVRLFRGIGAVCEVEDDRLRIHYSGDRLPAVEDSILALARAGESVHAVAGAAHTTCAGQPAIEVRTEGTAPTAATLLVFESGTYFLRDRALRYRLGAAGRQPITDERFAPTSPPVRLTPDGPAALVPVAWPSASGRAADTVRIHFANGRG